MSVVVSFGYKTAARHFFSLIFDNKDAHSNADAASDDDVIVVLVMSHRSAEDQKVLVIRLDRSID